MELEFGSETRLLTHRLCLPSLWEQCNGPCGQQTGEGEGLGSLEITGCKSGPRGAEMGHCLKVLWVNRSRWASDTVYGFAPKTLISIM